MPADPIVGENNTPDIADDAPFDGKTVLIDCLSAGPACSCYESKSRIESDAPSMSFPRVLLSGRDEDGIGHISSSIENEARKDSQQGWHVHRHMAEPHLEADKTLSRPRLEAPRLAVSVELLEQASADREIDSSPSLEVFPFYVDDIENPQLHNARSVLLDQDNFVNSAQINETYIFLIYLPTMSDPTVEPGAPVENQADSIPPASDGSVAKEVEKRAPARLLELAKQPDRILLRLSKYV